METAIPALIIIMLIIAGTLTLTHGFLAAQDAMQESWREMEERMAERTRTRVSTVGAQATDLGATVVVTLSNAGETKLADFEQWDVILEYTGSDSQHYTEWYPFGLGQNEWTKTGIYLDASTGSGEVFDKGILNPGEEMVLRMSLSPGVGSPTTNLVTVATPNGISASTAFTY